MVLTTNAGGVASWVPLRNAKVEAGVNRGLRDALEETHTCEIQRHQFRRIKEQAQRDPHCPSDDNDEGNDKERKLLPKKV